MTPRGDAVERALLLCGTGEQQRVICVRSCEKCDFSLSYKKIKCIFVVFFFKIYIKPSLEFWYKINIFVKRICFFFKIQSWYLCSYIGRYPICCIDIYKDGKAYYNRLPMEFFQTKRPPILPPFVWITIKSNNTKGLHHISISNNDAVRNYK